ncbi:MAG TPA: hypothetical protein VFM54_23285 [Micromonosporaceae bacterium]|nr:hypothetical protein [Micromonosporaceae bacterium]
MSPEANLRYFALRPCGEPPEASADAVASGRFTPLRRPDDLAHLPAGGAARVIAIDFERFKLRDPQFTATLAAGLRDAAEPVVLKGSLLSHFAALLREYGVPVYPVNELPPVREGTPVHVVAA